MLALVAAASICCGSALTVLPTTVAHASSDWFELCTTAAQTDCIESATANGVASAPGPSGVARDVVLVKLSDTPGVVNFGVQHDDGTGTLTPGITPEVTYRLVVRASTRARHVSGTVTRPKFYPDPDQNGHRFTLEFKPVAIRFVAPGACTVTSCGNSSTRSTLELSGVAYGTVSDLVSSGVGPVEAFDRAGIAEASSAQALATRHDYKLNNYTIKTGNPWRDASGEVQLDTVYEVFFPDFYLQTRFEIANPGALTRSSFNITRAVGGKLQGVNAGVFREPGGIRIWIYMMVGGTQTYRIHPKPGRPGFPRVGGAGKYNKTSVQVGTLAPYATGGTAVDRYQARCRPKGTAKWFYGSARRSPVVHHLPRRAVATYRVVCQVRAHNKIGYGAYSEIVGM